LTVVSVFLTLIKAFRLLCLSPPKAKEKNSDEGGTH
jgi:hypothetical protein